MPRINQASVIKVRNLPRELLNEFLVMSRPHECEALLVVIVIQDLKEAV